MQRRDQISVPIHFTIASSFSSGIFVPTLSPTDLAAYSTRLAALADEYCHYRIKSFRCRLHPPASAAAAPQALGVIGGVQDTLPGTVAQITELIPSTFLSHETTVPTEWVNVPKQDLQGPLPWYKSIRGSADVTEETPGYLVAAGGASDVVYIEVRALYEFKTAVAPANTPAYLALRKQLLAARVDSERQKNRDVILRTLSAKLGTSDTSSARMADKLPGPQVPAQKDYAQPGIRFGGDYP